MRKTILLISILFLFSGMLQASEKALLFRFKGTGVDEELIDAVNQIFGSDLSQQGKYTTISAVSVVGNVECNSLPCAVDYAEESGFPKAIIGNLTRLGRKLILNVQLIDVETEEIMLGVDAVSETEEDLDIVLKRLAKSITSGKGMDKTTEVGLVTESEARPERKRSSFTSKGLRAGFMWPSAYSFGKETERLTVIDFVVQHDMRDYFLSGRSGLKWGDNSAFNLTILETKIGRYLSRGDFSPFISGGMGIQYNRARIEIENKPGTYRASGTGLSLSGGVGLAAFRTYDFQFQIDVDYFIVLTKLESDGASGGEYPQGIIFTFCIKH
ncbi:hypothetical protein J7M07_00900 [bacterium]|nr:hypothetical protein [bacterium]